MSKIRKLGRPSLVCSNCKRRKIKCDRNQPCIQCVRSDIGITCSYDHCDMKPIGAGSSNDSNIDSTSETDSNYSRLNSELFNYPSLEFKKPSFVKEENNIKYEPPLSLEAIFNNNKHFVKFRSLMPFLFNVKENEIYKESQTLNSKVELKVLVDTYTIDEINELINTLFMPNIEAIKERIYFFGKEMIPSTSMAFIPMKTPLEIFNKCIIPHPFEVNKYICKELNDETEYALFAIIFIMVKMVSFTSEFDKSINFKYSLNLSISQLNDSSLKFLSFSNYKEKPTFNSLLAFLLYRMNYFISDSISEHSNAESFFNITLEICYKLGIHIRCDHIEGYEEDHVRRVWNALQFLDCISAFHVGQPLKIDYRYAVPRLFGFWEPIILYFRKIVLSINSVQPITLNEIIDLTQDAIKLFSVFKSFDTLLNENAVNFFFPIIIKCDFLICYETLLLILRLSIDDISKIPVKIDDRDLRLIEDLKLKCECQLFYGMILSTRLIKDISTGNFSKHNGKLLILMKLIFGRYLLLSNNIIFSYLSVFDKAKQSNKPISTLKYNDVSIAELEKYICKELDNITFEDFEYKKMRLLMGSIPKLNEYLIDFYKTISENCPMILDGYFNVYFKFLLFVCRLLQVTYEYTDNQTSIDTNFQFKLDDWKIVIDKTTNYFINSGDNNEDNNMSSNSTSNSNTNVNESLQWGLPTNEVGTNLNADDLKGIDDMFFGLEGNSGMLNSPINGNNKNGEPKLNESEALITGSSKHFNTSDWAFLVSNEIRDKLGYAEDNAKESTEFDEIFQMFIE